jgi:hypothetical protein
MTVSGWTRLVLPLSLAGCASVQPLSNPAAFISQTRPSVVYVTHNNGAILTIAEPRVSGDSLLGTWKGAEQSLALPFQEVKEVQALRNDKVRTTFLVAGVSLIGVALGYQLIRNSGDGQEPCNFENATQFQGCDNPR